MNVVDGMASLVKVIGNRFVSSVFNVRKVFFEAGVKRASSFTDVELSTFGTMNDIYNVVCQAVELLCDVHLGLRASNIGVGADERTCSTFCLIAWTGPWCSCGIHPINFSFIEALQPAEGGSPETPSGLFHFAPLLV